MQSRSFFQVVFLWGCLVSTFSFSAVSATESVTPKGSRIFQKLRSETEMTALMSRLSEPARLSSEQHFERAFNEIIQISNALEDDEFRAYLGFLLNHRPMMDSYLHETRGPGFWLILAIHRITRARFQTNKAFKESNLASVTDRLYQRAFEQLEPRGEDLPVRAFLYYQQFQNATTAVDRMSTVRSMLLVVIKDSFAREKFGDGFLAMALSSWMLNPLTIYRRNTADIMLKVSMTHLSSSNLVLQRLSYFAAVMSAGILGRPLPQYQVGRPLEVEDFRQLGLNRGIALYLYASVLDLLHPLMTVPRAAADLDSFRKVYQAASAERDAVMIDSYMREGMLPTYGFKKESALVQKPSCSLSLTQSLQ